MYRQRLLSLISLTLLWTAAASSIVADEVRPLLATIREVRTSGESTRQAAVAWKRLVREPPEKLTTILASLEGAGPLAANWLRAAVDAIAERTLRDGGRLPTADLERFVLNTDHDPRGRRLAFEWLARVDGSARDRIIPGMLNDPSVELRREAVSRLVEEADSLARNKHETRAMSLYEIALDGARDDDQIKKIVKQLRSRGRQVDLQTHFGFLTHWKVIGPFDNSGRKGFDAVYPPEQSPGTDSTYRGKNGDVRWIEYATDDDYGMVDLNKPLGDEKETVGYARTEFNSAGEQEVEFRLGCKNAFKLWVNGELLFGRDEYHRGMRLDQYQMKTRLKPGRNDVLMKVCQNEEVETWTVEWQFQLRVCDHAGTAILSAE